MVQFVKCSQISCICISWSFCSGCGHGSGSVVEFHSCFCSLNYVGNNAIYHIVCGYIQRVRSKCFIILLDIIYSITLQHIAVKDIVYN